ncbi:gluconate 2-dehydrogenase subunit 3 family protein [Stenotrophomonas sp. S48]|uniref:gluconate 2-dehydrogenase subunit 3 family protein n=1 Tax=unclassified Stenotrophomonas TaxID=196198 RepID=UPI0019014A61|nr:MULTISPECIES: gluconate 2-dehydrogenase subunit 3 family protein [unclassified Stenotrophomonas]MBK0027128.1 gluconate 2-dehydrogenase subunit 3 family protein [Stenotrophomonas sp. S48]MBK0049190.1 gluconate 2-dehydrogenase subunit 3 family protein [Stenotrophomonas sp. S49]
MNDDAEPMAPALSRRRFFQSLTLIPVAAALPACAPGTPAADAQAPAADTVDYRPEFFNAAEWAFIVAACDRLIPADETGPGAVESGVPEFLDRHMQTPYAAGAIWYMQGPFLQAPSEFGYQGKLPLRDIVRVGIGAVDAHCREQFQGKTFAQLDHAQQEILLKAAEGGKLELDAISSKLFFSNLLGEVKNGYFADPKYGANKGMAAWKMIGYPGMRADYLDWIGVRDKAYPLPPVDLAGRRG